MGNTVQILEQLVEAKRQEVEALRAEQHRIAREIAMASAYIVAGRRMLSLEGVLPVEPTRRRKRERPTGEGTPRLKPEFAEGSIVEGVATILARSGIAMNAEMICAELYDGMPERNERGRHSLSAHLSLGHSQGLWIRPRFGFYQANKSPNGDATPLTFASKPISLPDAVHFGADLR